MTVTGTGARSSRVPIAIASQIHYEPMLSVDRSFLHQRMPSGAVFKINIVYDEPFWRADGLTGQSAAPGTPAPVTIDACTDTGTPGVLCVIVEGPTARDMCAIDAGQRCGLILGELAARFGPRRGRRSTSSSRTGPPNAIRAAG